MGFSSLAVIFNVISQVYDIDFRVNQYYQQKRDLTQWSKMIGLRQTQASRLAPGQYGRFVDIIWPSDPRYQRNPFQDPLLEDPVWDNGVYAPPPGIPLPPGGAPLSPNEQLMTSEQMLAEVEQDMREIKAMEEQIDIELERLKSMRTALVQQREEYTKYISEGIKNTFKNNYA